MTKWQDTQSVELTLQWKKIVRPTATMRRMRRFFSYFLRKKIER